MSGPAFALIAAFLFGVSSPVAKGLLGATDPWLLAGLLYLGSGIGMTVVYGMRRVFSGAGHQTPMLRGDVPWLVGATLFGGILGPVSLMYGLSITSASTASLLLNLEGVFSAAIAWTAFREHVDRRIAAGMGLIVLGGSVLAWPSNWSGTGLSGPVFVVVACLCWAIDNNLTRKISLNDPVLLTLIKSLAAGATNFALAVGFGARLPPLRFVTEAGAIGFLGYGMSLVCFIVALRHLGASRTGAYFSSAPFIGAVVAVSFWPEPVTATLVLAAFMMAAGIYLHLTEVHEHEHLHDEQVHEHSHSHDEHHRHGHSPGDPPGEPHTHPHRHEAVRHRHRHFPDMHHLHSH